MNSSRTSPGKPIRLLDLDLKPQSKFLRTRNEDHLTTAETTPPTKHAEAMAELELEEEFAQNLRLEKIMSAEEKLAKTAT